MQGINWMIYSGNNPVDQVDASGRSVRTAVMAMITAMLGGLSAECFVFACFTENPVQKKFFEWMSAAFAFMAAAMGIATAADAASDLAPGPAKLVCGVIAICSCAGALAAALGFYLAFRDWLALLDEEGALPDWLSAANNKLNYGTDGN